MRLQWAIRTGEELCFKPLMNLLMGLKLYADYMYISYHIDLNIFSPFNYIVALLGSVYHNIYINI